MSTSERTPPKSSRTSSILMQPFGLFIRSTSCAVSTVFLIGFALQLILSYLPWSVCYMMYLNHASWPPKYLLDFSNLSFYDVEGSNFYIEANNVTLGVWLLHPENHTTNPRPNMPVVLYVHGNAGSRATLCRTRLYTNLQRLGFTVVAFDYRGYGDSSGTPWGEQDLVNDGFAVYEWTRKEYPNKEIFIWGHSLGTGVSTHLTQFIERQGLKVDGLILDSPFSDLEDAMRSHPLLFPLHFVPGFTETVAKAMKIMEVNLNNSAAVLTLRLPILILHAEDDNVVPFHLGQKLYNIAQTRDAPVSFVTFRRELGYGHKGIYQDPDLPRIVNDFFDVCRRHGGRVPNAPPLEA
ncbi:Monoacylglycerol lipase ABHD12 [Hypsibius exemplaris]|uniref:Monoacylglycerol lipase ABHD12 n=1 Tax=Hypsibius exemplaris TaxID=2072580 RepID=A0A1W0XBM8_HYPEX|nr:Monoacylglycerol lipase ABHD12 [Hypsibius exemplaris]